MRQKILFLLPIIIINIVLLINSTTVANGALCDSSAGSALQGTLVDSATQQKINQYITIKFIGKSCDVGTDTGDFEYPCPGGVVLPVTAEIIDPNNPTKYLGRNYTFTNCAKTANTIELIRAAVPPTPNGPTPTTPLGQLSCGADCSGLTTLHCPASCPCYTFSAGNSKCTASSALPPTPTPESTALCDPCGYCQSAGNPVPFGHDKCMECVTGNQGSWTAFGCIPSDFNKFLQWLLPAVIGFAGGIAFLLMLYGVFTVIISSGNPEKINQGKEIIVSAIAGLLMILFSVFILKLIGVNILGIPGFG